MKNPLAVASRAKSPATVWRRARSLVCRYGLTAASMDRALGRFGQALDQFQCGASFALTAAVLERYHPVIAHCREHNIEFLLHGYIHTDYSRLEPRQQAAHLDRACRVFALAGLAPIGFRSPYLCGGPSLYAQLQAAGIAYISDQTILWDVAGADAAPGFANYARAIDFYAPWLAAERPSLPRFQAGMIQIPVSLPDDEMLVERLSAPGRTGVASDSDAWCERAWLPILAETYRRGELFTLQLHPERIACCAAALAAILSAARAHNPPVWIARLDEIAAWWRARTNSVATVVETHGGEWQITVQGPPGVTLLARGVEVAGPTTPWGAGYLRLPGAGGVVGATARPVIGLSPACPPALADFLRQQGYLVESSAEARCCALYLDQAAFGPEDERALLTRIETGREPLVRLGRWPHGAHSALAITGDIDALTLLDFGLRLFGK